MDPELPAGATKKKTRCIKETGGRLFEIFRNNPLGDVSNYGNSLMLYLVFCEDTRMSKKVRLDAIEVKSPCSENWAEMQGTDKVRFCSHCAHTVNDISRLTRKEALRLVRGSEGRICIRYIPDPSTKRPVFSENLYSITRRAPGLAAGVMTASIALSTAAYAQEADNTFILDGAEITSFRGLTPVERKPAKAHTGETEPGLYGVITDANGAVIAGHPVVLIDENSGEEIRVSSNEEGRYEFIDVPQGTYKLLFESAQGFSPKSRSGLSISPGDSIRYNVSLDAGAVMGMFFSVEETPLRNALSRAVEDDDIEKVRDLITRHANVNAKEKDRQDITPLFIAVDNNNFEIAEVLLLFGAKVNARDKDRRTPLMMIDDDTPLELVELLLKYGAKVDVEDKDGNTPLLRAADEGADVPVIMALLLAGADVNHKNKEGETAWDLTGSDEVEKLLESRGGRSGDPEETDDDPEPKAAQPDAN